LFEASISYLPPRCDRFRGNPGRVRRVASSRLAGVGSFAPAPVLGPPGACIADSSRHTSSLGYKLPRLARASSRSRRTGPLPVAQLIRRPPPRSSPLFCPTRPTRPTRPTCPTRPICPLPSLCPIGPSICAPIGHGASGGSGMLKSTLRKPRSNVRHGQWSISPSDESPKGGVGAVPEPTSCPMHPLNL